MLRIGIFISEEGYGHAARQIAIAQCLLRSNSNIEIIFYCDRLTEFISDRIPDHLRQKIRFRHFSNSFHLYKNSWGCIDFEQSLDLLLEGVSTSDVQSLYLLDGCKDLDVIISDSVPYVSLTAEKLGIPSFSVNHFSWSWYISRLIASSDQLSLNNTHLLEQSIYQYSKFRTQFILPLYFEDDPCVSLSNAQMLDEFIISRDLTDDHSNFSGHEKSILLMDNGTRSLKKVIEDLAPSITSSNLLFTIKINDLRSDIQQIFLNSKNVSCVFSAREMHHQIMYSKALIARGGFNTISESVFSRTPAAYIHETGNPEITANLDQIKRLDYGLIFTSEELLDDFSAITEKLNSVKVKQQSLELNRKFKFTAAETIALRILSA